MVQDAGPFPIDAFFPSIPLEKRLGLEGLAVA